MRILARPALIAALVSGCAQPEPVPESVPESVPEPVPEPVLLEISPDPATLGDLITYPKFADADPFEWTARRPQSYPIHGIDVSRWQGNINWPQAKAAGVTFAYIKATEGGDVADPGFAINWQAA